MSWQATNWVIQNSQHKGSSLLTLLCIANCSNESGSDCWPSFGRLAKDTRMSKRQLIRVIEKLEKSGELGVEHSEGRWPNHYSFPLMKTNGDKMTPLKKKQIVTNSPTNGDISAINGDIAMSPDPSLEQSKNNQGAGKPPPQIELIRNITRLYPPKVIWNDLTTILGAAPSRPKLERCFKEWILRGNKPTNYTWISEWYVKGGPPLNGRYLPTQAEMNRGGQGKLVL